MDHRFIVTAKVHSRNQFPRVSLREVQLVEDLYGFVQAEPILTYNNVFPNGTYFPLEGTTKYIKK